jgi:hypothetical protein
MRQITVVVKRKVDPRRWAEVTVDVIDRLGMEPFLCCTVPPFWMIYPADRLAAGRRRALWEEAIQGGLREVWRDFRGTAFRVAAIRGVLGWEDLDGLALACRTALLKLLGSDFMVPTAAWQIQTTTAGYPCLNEAGEARVRGLPWDVTDF